MYKNWPEICKIENQLLRMFVATLDITSDMADRFIAAFPEFFSQTKERGPIPLSVLMDHSQHVDACENPPRGYSERNISHKTISYYHIPTITYQGYSYMRSMHGPPDLSLGELTPTDFPRSRRFGRTFTWRGTELFITHAMNDGNDYYDPDFVTCCPAECIFIDVPSYLPEVQNTPVTSLSISDDAKFELHMHSIFTVSDIAYAMFDTVNRDSISSDDLTRIKDILEKYGYEWPRPLR